MHEKKKAKERKSNMDILYNLFSKLSKDTLVLTANKRLSTWLVKQFNAAQTKPAWETPTILPIQTWLESQWNMALLHGKTHKTLLTIFQEKLLWQQIIAQNHENALLHISGTANIAQQAWALCQEWRLPLDDQTFGETDSCKHFYEWAQTFLTHCEEKDLSSSILLYQSITDLFQEGSLTPPSHIVLLGFVEKTPALIHLLNTLRELGAEIEEINLNHKNQSAQRIAIKNTQTEISTMANWAKSRYKNNKNIACIVPELNQSRSMIERVFTEIFHDEKQLFNISSGTPLSDEPLIEIALSILELKPKKILINDLGHLLRTPFIANAEEKLSARALIDEDIRARGNVAYHLSELSQFFTEETDKSFFNAIKQTLAINAPAKQIPSKWAETFLRQLNVWGWPGERVLNSREYQTIEHLKLLLNNFSRLDNVISTIKISTAIQTLRQLAINTLFQPQTTDAPIQILGMLEINGLTFDDAWIMGLDHQHWPSKPKPNPLLPIKLQRQLKMPHASSARELDFCKLMTEQFLNCASTVICSYPTQTDDRALSASPLIENLSEMTFDELNLPDYKTPEENLFGSEETEHLVDNFASPISEKEKNRGGTKIFKSQAACPFRAFATLRLKAESISEPEIGLDAQVRGSLVHKALELFWRETKSHEKLISMTDEDKSSLVKWCVNKAIIQVLQDRHISQSIIKLEKLRLQNLLIDWLATEKDREPFKVIAQERWQEASIGKISFRMQVDRIDQLSNDHYAIIDYKTGHTAIGAWFGDRIDEPQLPLYAVCTNETISVIAFAQVKAGNMKFRGIGIDENLLPNTKKLVDISWQDQIKLWSKDLLALANDFYNGNAQVDPKDINKTCRHCGLHTLCRIYEK